MSIIFTTPDFITDAQRAELRADFIAYTDEGTHIVVAATPTEDVYAVVWYFLDGGHEEDFVSFGPANGHGRGALTEYSISEDVARRKLSGEPICYMERQGRPMSECSGCAGCA